MISTGHVAQRVIPWLDPYVETLHQAILYTLTYADIFDYPLSKHEIHRYLVGKFVPPDMVVNALDQGEHTGVWETNAGYYTLPGRNTLGAIRKHRERISVSLWERALKYGHIIANLPFVRMVAVTGALTMNNVETDDDIDYLIITEPGRVWLTRLLVVARVAKLAAWRGDEVCPNYVLSTHALHIQEHNLFTAHELTQMIPLMGKPLYEAMRRANKWSEAFLPNAAGPPVETDKVYAFQRHKYSVAEPLLRTPVGDWLERREMDKKIRKLSSLGGSQTETHYGPDHCKGHIDSHGNYAWTAFTERARRVSGLGAN